MTRSDLKGTEAVARRRGVPPDKIEPSADLKEKKCDQERLQYLGSIDMTEDLHHRVIGAGADQRGEMIGDVECKEDPDDDERRYTVGDPQRRRDRLDLCRRGCVPVGAEERHDGQCPACHPKPRVRHDRTSIVSTTPMKVNNVGAATASSAMRLARSCASVGWRISAKCIAATSAIVGTVKARRNKTAAMSQGSAQSLLVIVVTLALKPVRM
jgi:hypothetical protein